MQSPQSRFGDGLTWLEGDKVKPEYFMSLSNEIQNLLRAAGMEFDGERTDQIKEAVKALSAGAAKPVSREIRAYLDGSVDQVGTKAPWYPPHDAKLLHHVRLQLKVASLEDVVLAVLIGTTRHRFVLPARKTSVYIETAIPLEIDADTQDTVPVELAMETNGGDSLTIVLEYY